jgi:FixJ family two-component response regulator
LANAITDVICLLDDDPSVLKAVVRSLSLAGWRVKEFSDPEQFLLYVGTHVAAVAVIDVWMPLMNGLEVQSRLRELSPSTRVIIFTGKDDSDIRSRALNAGASAFLTKPLDDEELLTAVRFALASAA